MQGLKEKTKDLASSAMAKMKGHEAKVEEKMDKAAARSEVQKEIAHERARAKIAEAKMDMHAEKAQHREESMMHRQHHHHHLPHGHVGVQPVYGNPTTASALSPAPAPTPAPATTPTMPAYPLSGAYPATKK